MKAKPDFSRMVVLTLSPSEAAVLTGVLAVVLKRLEEPPEINEVISGTLQHLSHQLKVLRWPAPPAEKRAPYPL
jgi:hypothetical protein